MNYLSFLTGEIQFDLKDKTLLGIILFSILKGFSLVCGPWAFPTTPVIILWDKRTGLSFWVSARDLGVSLGWPLS